jgi:AGZA family xanthine/uracil permease-like MFS transporter
MNNFFQLKKNKTSVATEFYGGLSTFLASFYIIIVNPAILSQAGLSFQAVSTATIMVAAISTILMGLYANNPIALAPGMGLNAFFTYSVVMGKNISPEIALGVVFWAGVLFIGFSLLNVREKLIAFIPLQLRFAISCGIGIFIAFIGFVNGKVIIQHPATLVQMAPLNAMTITFIFALILTSFLVLKKIKAAFIIGIATTLLLSIPMGRWWGNDIIVQWQGFMSMPDFSLFGKLNFRDSLSLALWPTILAFMFTNLFDTISTLLGVSEAGNLLDKNGQPRNLKRSLLVDAFATVISGVFGTSPTTSYIESAAGIQQGARTGLAAVFTGLMFLPFLFLAPILSMFPLYTTAPVLVIVGIFMMTPITKIDWKQIDVALPCFLAITLIPLTFSITHGIVAALGCHFLFCLYKKLS